MNTPQKLGLFLGYETDIGPAYSKSCRKIYLGMRSRVATSRRQGYSHFISLFRGSDTGYSY